MAAKFLYPSHYNPQRELDAYNNGYLPVYGYEPMDTSQPVDRYTNPAYSHNDRLVIAGQQWGRDYNMTSALTNNPTDGNALIIVDGNGDFVLPNGALSVAGAMGDMERIVSWMYRNIDRIDHIVASMDAHYPIQIFHPLFWMDRKNQNRMPAPLTQILLENFGKRYQTEYVPDFDENWVRHYLESLKSSTRQVFDKSGRPIKIGHSAKDLTVWPTHTIIGTHMQALVPMISDALMFWTGARGKNFDIVQKGINLWTEWYSILESDVPVPSDPFTLINANIIDTLMSYKRVYICGWAKSHCVYETIQSLVWYLKVNAAHLLPNLYLLMDGMSSVGAITLDDGTVIDFEKMVQPQYEAWEKEGLNLVYTTDNNGLIAA